MFVVDNEYKIKKGRDDPYPYPYPYPHPHPFQPVPHSHPHPVPRLHTLSDFFYGSAKAYQINY
jgi:hypothetical protein